MPARSLRRPWLLLVGIVLSGIAAFIPVGAQRPRARADSVALLPAARVSATTTGVSIAVLDSAEIAASGARTLSELLLARVPGLSVRHRGGTEADGFEIASRGMIPGSGGSPLLVVDGIMADAHQALPVPGTSIALSRLDDLVPADVQRIEVLRGPAASALYGAGAAAGVIVVTTRRGGAGPLRLDVSGGVGLTDVDARFPANYQLTSGAPGAVCNPRLFPSQTAANCSPMTLYSWNPLEQASPFQVGRNVTGGAALSGTTLGTRVFGGLSAERATGVTDDDRQSRLGVRGSVERSLPGHVTVSAQGSYLQRDAGVPPRGDVLDNVIARGMLGSAYDDSLRGYSDVAWAPRVVDPAEPSLTRATTALRVGWEPTGWLSVDALAGQDRTRERALRTDAFTDPLGPTGDYSYIRDRWTSGTMHAGATTRYRAPANVEMETYVGYDDVRTHDQTVDSTGIGRFFSSISWTTGQTRLQEATIRQHVGVGDLLDVNGGARFSVGHGISAPFGRTASRNVDAVLRLPAPRPGIDLRLRAAAGLVPLVLPGSIYLVSNGTFGGVTVEELRSRQSEREGGIDAAFGARARLELTWFRSQARDVAVGYGQASPVGFPIPNPVLADFSNSGLEAVASAQLIQGTRIGWRSTVTLTMPRSNVTRVSGIPLRSRNGFLTAGHPLQGYWSSEYTWSDANGDGLISMGEVAPEQSSTYVGPSRPTLEMGLHNALSLPHGLTVAALLDYRAGQYRDDLSEATRCGYALAGCLGIWDPAQSLTDQARWSAVTNGVVRDISPASYLRLREIVIEWAPPDPEQSVARRLSVRVVGQNLLTWTQYEGVDPEVGASSFQAWVGPSELFDAPLPRRIRVEARVGVM